MKPYQIDIGSNKIINGNHPFCLRGGSKKDKLVTKNANRSRKKAYRAFLKRQLNEEINMVPHRCS